MIAPGPVRMPLGCLTKQPLASQLISPPASPVRGHLVGFEPRFLSPYTSTIRLLLYLKHGIAYTVTIELDGCVGD